MRCPSILDLVRRPSGFQVRTERLERAKFWAYINEYVDLCSNVIVPTLVFEWDSMTGS